MRDPIDVILENEGGYVNNPNDKGGATNWGITIGTYSDWLKRPATVDEVRNMTKETAREIYEVRYLSGPRIDQLPEPLKTHILDIGVNSGPPAAIKILQRVLNKAGFGPVDVDGVLGPATRGKVLEALNEMGPYLNNAIVDERKAMYANIIANNPTQEQFRKGWMNRAESFRIPV